MNDPMNTEVAKRVDRALKDLIADLIVANTELKVRVQLLTEKVAEQEQADQQKVKSPPLRSVQD